MTDQSEFRENLFVSCGTAVKFASGATLIEEGKPSDCAIYIKKGTVTLRKKGAPPASRDASAQSSCTHELTSPILARRCSLWRRGSPLS